jgi:hypothetical protein
MFEKLSQMAERAATSVSRRQFLGRMGRSAMTLAAAAGGVLLAPTVSQAARHCGGQICPPGYNYCCRIYVHEPRKHFFHVCSISRCR